MYRIRSRPHKLSEVGDRTHFVEKAQLQNNPDKQRDEPLFLEHRWTFWIDKYPGPNRPVKEYRDALVKLGTVGTVQDFWKWMNHLPSPHQLAFGTRYHLMKEGVEPLWEDPANIYGGTIAIRVAKEDIEATWLRILLGVIGEQLSLLLQDGDQVCGITSSIRRREALVSIWHKENKLIDVPRVKEYIIKRLLNAIPIMEISYKVHNLQLNFKGDETETMECNVPIALNSPCAPPSK